VVQRDVAAVLAAGTSGSMQGISLIADEHAIAFGANASGQHATCAGQGYLMHDGGSAFDLGQRALLAVHKVGLPAEPCTAPSLVHNMLGLLTVHTACWYG
jgi:hypothetical protein